MRSVTRYTGGDMTIYDLSGLNDHNLDGLQVPFNDGFSDTNKFIRVVLSIPKLHILLKNDYCSKWKFENTPEQRNHLENFIKSHYLIYNTLKPEVEYYLLYLRLTGNLSETAELLDWDQIRSTLKYISMWANADDETLRDAVLDYYINDPTPIINLLLTEILQAKASTFQNRCEYTIANLDSSKKEQKVDMVVAKRWTSPVRFNIGKTYILRSESLDGATIHERKFVLKYVLKNYEDIPIDLLIMKRAEDCPKGLIFCLNKADCKRIGITYESGLEVWPMEANWEYDEEGIEASDDEKTLDDFIKSSNRYVQHQDDGSKKRPTTFRCIQEQNCSEQIEAAETQEQEEKERIRKKLIEGLEVWEDKLQAKIAAQRALERKKYERDILNTALNIYNNTPEQRLNKQLWQLLDVEKYDMKTNHCYLPSKWDSCQKASDRAWDEDL